MIRKLAVLIVAASLLFTLVSCNKNKEINCEIGNTYSTEWFEFTIESIESVEFYDWYTPEEGNILIDVLITVKGTFESRPVPLGTFDFYMDSETFADYLWPLDPFDSTMMPLEFNLPFGEEAAFHMIYEAPSGISDLTLIYKEIAEDGTEYKTFRFTVDIGG